MTAKTTKMMKMTMTPGHLCDTSCQLTMLAKFGALTWSTDVRVPVDQAFG